MALPELKVRVTADTSKAKEGMRSVGDEARRLNKSVDQAARGMKKLSGSMRSSAAHTANIGAQFNDIGVMLAAGQNPFQLAVQQGTQLNQVMAQMGGGKRALAGLAQGFMSMINPMSLATIGIIAGGAALVQWATNAGDAGEKAKKFAEDLAKVAEVQAALNKELRMSYLGVSSEELTLRDAIADQAERLRKAEEHLARGGFRRLETARQAVEVERKAMAALQGQLENLQKLQAAKSRILETTKGMSDKERLLGQQMSFTAAELAESESIAQLLRDGLSASAIEAIKLAGVDMASGISAATREAAALAANLGIALSEAISLKNLQDSMTYGGRGGDPRDFMSGQGRSLDQPTIEELIELYKPRKARTGGGGGRGAGRSVSTDDTLRADLENLQVALQTETETVQAEYDKRIELLASAKEKEFITQERYQELSKRSAQGYRDAMSQIDRGYHGSTLDQAGAFFGDMATAFQSGNEKLQKISSAFAATEALINAWRAYSQVMADPSLPFIAKVPAALSVLGAGMNAVSAIKGIGGGGGSSGGGSRGGGGAGASAAAAPQQAAPAPLEVRASGFGPGDLFTGSMVTKLFDKIQDEAGDRGYRVVFTQ